MAKTLLNIKIDPKVKRDVKKIAEEFGLPLSTLINANLKQLIREKSIRLSVGYEMSANLEKQLKVIDEDIKKGQNLSPAFVSTTEMDRYLDSI